jgi:hypothetical protein
VSDKCRICRMYAGEGGGVFARLNSCWFVKMIENQYSDRDSDSESHVFYQELLINKYS